VITTMMAPHHNIIEVLLKMAVAPITVFLHIYMYFACSFKICSLSKCSLNQFVLWQNFYWTNLSSDKIFAEPICPIKRGSHINYFCIVIYQCSFTFHQIFHYFDQWPSSMWKITLKLKSHVHTIISSHFRLILLF
jgi:hypothetical protein